MAYHVIWYIFILLFYEKYTISWSHPAISLLTARSHGRFTFYLFVSIGSRLKKKKNRLSRRSTHFSHPPFVIKHVTWEYVRGTEYRMWIFKACHFDVCRRLDWIFFFVYISLFILDFSHSRRLDFFFSPTGLFSFFLVR